MELTLLDRGGPYVLPLGIHLPLHLSRVLSRGVCSSVIGRRGIALRFCLVQAQLHLFSVILRRNRQRAVLALRHHSPRFAPLLLALRRWVGEEGCAGLDGLVEGPLGIGSWRKVIPESRIEVLDVLVEVGRTRLWHLSNLELALLGYQRTVGCSLVDTPHRPLLRRRVETTQAPTLFDLGRHILSLLHLSPNDHSAPEPLTALGFHLVGPGVLRMNVDRLLLRAHISQNTRWLLCHHC